MDTMTRFVELVALVLREHADRVGLSGAELARRSGVSQGQISRIFTGKRTVSVDHVVALANALGVRGSDVFAEAEQRLAAESAGVVDVALAECQSAKDAGSSDPL